MNRHRRMCNVVKRDLYTKIKHKLNQINLLEIASGRGGDMHKWISLGFEEVRAFDVSEKAVNEAIRRYENKSNKGSCIVRWFLGDMNTVEPFVFEDGYMANCVSCQFAIHYVEDVETFFENVSARLLPGGYFIGISPDGDLIEYIVKNNIQHEFIDLKPVNDSQYTFTPRKVSTNDYFEFNGHVSVENYVRKHELLTFARKNEFQCVELFRLSQKYEKMNSIGDLFFAFIFQKNRIH